MQIILIAAMGSNRVIGNNGKLPWHSPEDLKHFREVTMGHPVIMGRKTYESIGKPFDGRRTVIVSKGSMGFPGAVASTGLDHALNFCRYDQKAFIAGGQSLYEQAIGFADKLILTYIDRPFDGDAVFPDIDLRNGWQRIKRCHGTEPLVEYWELERRNG